MSPGPDLDTEEWSPGAAEEETSDMAPAPATAVGSIPRFRRELLSHQVALRSLLEALLLYQKSPAFEVTREVAIVLACAATDKAFPPLDRDSDRGFESALIAAEKGRCRPHTELAIAIVENALKICLAGLASLAMVDALDETVPSNWHNLHPAIVARRLARLGHSLARGAIPGWRDENG